MVPLPFRMSTGWFFIVSGFMQPEPAFDEFLVFMYARLSLNV